MKKQIRTAIIIAIVIIFSCALALPAIAELGDRGDFYPRLTIITETERVEDDDLWVVYCQDKNGNIWAFFSDTDEWNRGDIANLLMRNVGEREEDDEIIDVYWEGYTENIEMFFFLEGWR